MTAQPQVWHHGLVARWWAEFNLDGPEISHFRAFIDRSGQPALDAACGTGRLLIPYLKSGLDVDGCDISADMLALCADRARVEGLAPRLYQQALHELVLPRAYRTIVLCGGFGLGATRAQDQEALNRLFSHLQPSGTLVFDLYLPYGWPYWTKEARQSLPQPWPEAGDRKRTADGHEIELRRRLLAFDPLDQLATRQIRAILWQNDRILREEEHTLAERLYYRNEVLQMLSIAGFQVTDLLSDHSEQPASSDSEVLTFVATKAS